VPHEKVSKIGLSFNIVDLRPATMRIRICPAGRNCRSNHTDRLPLLPVRHDRVSSSSAFMRMRRCTRHDMQRCRRDTRRGPAATPLIVIHSRQDSYSGVQRLGQVRLFPVFRNQRHRRGVINSLRLAAAAIRSSGERMQGECSAPLHSSLGGRPHRASWRDG
jgi:hypothetical protein